jgi:hypothetical protein
VPTLTLADGSSLTWADQSVPGPSAAAPEPVVVAPDPEPMTAEAPSVTAADVQAAAARIPPKWAASGWRFIRTLAAAVIAALAAYGGDIAALLADPKALGALVLTALLSAGDKAFRWKEEA